MEGPFLIAGPVPETPNFELYFGTLSCYLRAFMAIGPKFLTPLIPLSSALNVIASKELTYQPFLVQAIIFLNSE